MSRGKAISPVTQKHIAQDTENSGIPVGDSCQLSKRTYSGQESKGSSPGQSDSRDQSTSSKSSHQIEIKSPSAHPSKQPFSSNSQIFGSEPEAAFNNVVLTTEKQVRFAESLSNAERNFSVGSRIEEMPNPTIPTGSPASNKPSPKPKWPSSHGSCIKGQVEVPVGISRLHLVDLPTLQMKPIYWSPVHDVSRVVRGTWFYKRTMYPVESDVANLLEIAYGYMKPWSQEYTDEINSCLDAGPDAENKLAQCLWPEEILKDLHQLNAKAESENGVSLSQDNSESTFEGEKVADKIRVMFAEKMKGTVRKPSPPDVQPEIPRSEILSDSGGGSFPEITPFTKTDQSSATQTASYFENMAVGDFDLGSRRGNLDILYRDYKLIFANAREAQILKPSQSPSPGTRFSSARRPLGPICRGKVIGIPVVRGFDHALWNKLHPADQSKVVMHARAGARASESGTAAIPKSVNIGPAYATVENQPKVTDLILVIHGIGQKLSERVESFNFTHSINSLRRQINVELGSGAVRSWLRKDLGGIMVLPVNWRSTVSLDDEHGGMESNASQIDFVLKDITAPGIPAVRNLISDVLLDIPYYFSVDHKPKMIAAVVKEANRIYRRWCHNNPGFATSGRVHLIAHSLGSVMAVDILSRQPTQLPASVDLTSSQISDNMFEFDTKSLFFCGSPTGFFLLLNKAPLIPRKGRQKPGSDSGDTLSTGHEGEVGAWGCMAVDNVYNILHKNDPIAYRLNACVSVSYSNSLLPATIPNPSAGWLQSLSSSVGLTTATLPTGTSDTTLKRPVTQKLPSSVELETHNFSEEEIAEKKMYRLNDNGQIDYYLSTGGGPLEFQYWNMLGAHSSYWELADFVRFVVVEVGRKFGKENTFAPHRVVKKGWQGGRELAGKKISGKK